VPLVIAVEKRAMPHDTQESHWTWTLYANVSKLKAIARAEESFDSPVEARKDAAAFVATAGIKAAIQSPAGKRKPAEPRPAKRPLPPLPKDRHPDAPYARLE
jgi:hypothetical protein